MSLWRITTGRVRGRGFTSPVACRRLNPASVQSGIGAPLRLPDRDLPFGLMGNDTLSAAIAKVQVAGLIRLCRS